VLNHLIKHHSFNGDLSNLLQWLFTGTGIIYSLELIATLAYAVVGAVTVIEYRRDQQEIDLLGVIFVGSICTAVGGGSIRCCLIGSKPFVITCPEYLFGAVKRYC
jgi:uncharacterized membrane protein YeiH